MRGSGVLTNNDPRRKQNRSTEGCSKLKRSVDMTTWQQSQNFNLITNIKSFDFFTLYTTIPHQKLKSRLASLIRNSFLHKNVNRRYKYLVLGREGPYFVKEQLWFEEQVHWRRHHQGARVSSWQHFRCLRGKGFQQIIGIPMAQTVPLS